MENLGIGLGLGKKTTSDNRKIVDLGIEYDLHITTSSERKTKTYYYPSGPVLKFDSLAIKSPRTKKKEN